MGLLARLPSGLLAVGGEHPEIGADLNRGKDVLWYTTKPPKNHRKLLFFVRVCAVCTSCVIRCKPCFTNGYQLKRLVCLDKFLDYTSALNVSCESRKGNLHARFD